MTTLLLQILGEGLKAWNTERGRSLYNDYLKQMKVYDEQMDRKSRTGKYSQLAVDKCMRDLELIAKAYHEFIKSNPTIQ
jgi:hypothetical protein